jgi:GNAT superfamily N-acetyltransferase
MDIQCAKASQIDDLAIFYRITDYDGSVAPADRVVYATEKEKIIGAGRLSKEKGVLVLRGMRVLENHQGCGVGRAILESLVKEGRNNECYCLPYRYLQPFYAAKGFDKIAPSEAPGFLRNRFKDYRARGLDVILMRKKPLA